MNTLTNEITQELLDAVGNPAGLEAVFQQHSHSKGPFYHALAQATASLTERFSTLAQKCKEAEKEYQQRQQQAKGTKQELASLEQGRAAKAKELAALEGQVKGKKELLDQAGALGGLGFGLGELAELHDMLAKVAASQGAKPEEAADLFFKEVERYQGIVSLELEAKRAGVAASKAKAEADRWQAEANAAEAKAKARKTSIDIAEKLLAQGVKESDLPQWTRILARAGVVPEGLAQALEQFASLEKLCHERQQQAEKLGGQVKELTSQVKALIEERQQVSAAIGAVRDKALAEIECTSRKTLQNLDALMVKTAEYRELERQAATLEHEIALARAFNSQEPGQWKQLPRRAVQELLTGLVLWSRADASHNPLLSSPPSYLSPQAYFYSVGSLRLEDVLVWALSGLLTEQERKALTGRA